MRIFSGGIATETNTFSPIPTGLADFPVARTLDELTGILGGDAIRAWQRMAAERSWDFTFGLYSFAQPAGTTTRATYETLRDELLERLRAAGPLDVVLLLLHGAMVADGYDDCEGDLIERVRAIVGPSVPIGVELDPHCHMTRKRVHNATLIICYKEFPHTDFVARGEEVVELTLQAARGQIKPVMSLVDCRMIGSFPTTIEPMRGFVDRISALEGKDGVLSISLAHCFPYADVPEMGARVLVVTDNRRQAGDTLARALADEFLGMRGKTQPDYQTPDEAIDIALKEAGTVVIADPSDNPGGGAPGDSTVILRRLIERGIKGAALGPVWDPMAVRMCFLAGVGGTLDLRLGGKIAPTSGQPIDARVTVTKLVRDATQTFVDAKIALGDCAAISLGGIEVVLISKRTQAMGSDLFTGMGVALAGKKIVVVKSTNHFYAAFKPFASRVLYCDSGGPIPRDHRQVPYTRVQRPIWPLDDNVEPVLLT